MANQYDVQPVPHRDDEYGSYFIHTSEDNGKAVEEIDERERQRSVEEIEAAGQYHRMIEQERLEEMRLRKEHTDVQNVDMSDYVDRSQDPPGTRVNLLA